MINFAIKANVKIKIFDITQQNKSRVDRKEIRIVRGFANNTNLKNSIRRNHNIKLGYAIDKLHYQKSFLYKKIVTCHFYQNFGLSLGQ